MPTIVILDQDRFRRERLVQLTQRIDPAIHIEAFLEPEPALSWLQRHTADLLICDHTFPTVDTCHLIQQLRQTPNGNELPVLMMTPWEDRELRRCALDAGATDLLVSPIDDLEFHARCSNLLTQRRQKHIIHERARWLEQKVAAATSEVRQREHETLLRLARAGEYRDEDTGDHVIRMAKYSRVIAAQLGLSKDECDAIELAAPMHDIGKIGIPDEILRKPGRLTYTEFEIMKKHTQIGYEILKDSPSKYLQMGAIIALNHHERFNGAGYPNQIGGQDIPLAARIVSVADAYDALTSERPYKPRWEIQKTLDYINQQCGRFFDPDCLSAFMAQLENIKKIQFSFSNQEQQQTASR